MRSIIALIYLLLFFSYALSAQDKPQQSRQSEITSEKELRPTKNNETFRDDSTDAVVGMSGLSTTPGVSTTTGTGGTGTNDTVGYNTSSDIYKIERRDSIRKANKESRNDSVRNNNKRNE